MKTKKQSKPITKNSPNDKQTKVIDKPIQSKTAQENATVKKPRPLTIKQRKFIDAVVETWNASEAASRAYKTNNRVTAWSIWKENLQKPQIKAAIEDRLAAAKNMIYTIAMTWEKEDTRLRASQDIVDRNEGKAVQRMDIKWQLSIVSEDELLD